MEQDNAGTTCRCGTADGSPTSTGAGHDPLMAARKLVPIGAICMMFFAAACGWRTGPVGGGMLVGVVEGATVEPGVRAALQDGLTRALVGRGMYGGGPEISLAILDTDDRGVAAIPSTDAGTVGYRSTLVVEATVAGRPGCVVRVEQQRTWTQPSAAPIEASQARASAYAELAGFVSERVVDAILGRAECR